jgi:hypothetical protein
MSEVKVNKITPTTNCGTVTLGDSGDTVAIPCGVTLSNSGSITNSGTITNTGTISGGTITGTIDNQVNWDTTAKTAGFTAVAGNGYFVNTTSGAITVTLPATPSAGDLVGIKDYANTANTNNITIDRNGSNIQGTANNFTISVAGTSITLIYVDGTQGWVSTGAAKASDIAEQQLFVTATGGTITTSGDYKIHTFTGPGTFCVSCAGTAPGSNTVDYLVIAGGGGGSGGGAGAGGYRESKATGAPWAASPLATCASLPVTASPYPITVGGGGGGGYAGDGAPGSQSAGSNSIFSSITSAGGGAGSTWANNGFPQPKNNGGSGGGGGQRSATGGGNGNGNTPPVSPPQGNNGGPSAANGGVDGSAGGGGGAGATGNAGVPGTSGLGGNGTASSISGSPVTRAGGGGGGGRSPGSSAGSGGPGGGGAGTASGPGTATSGTTNTGSGGGGGGFTSDYGTGGNGGSGIVIIRYKFQ